MARAVAAPGATVAVRAVAVPGIMPFWSAADSAALPPSFVMNCVL